MSDFADYIDYLDSIHVRVDEMVLLRRERAVMCGDCGVSWTVGNVCQWCDGYAAPMPNTNLKRKDKEVCRTAAEDNSAK